MEQVLLLFIPMGYHVPISSLSSSLSFLYSLDFTFTEGERKMNSRLDRFPHPSRMKLIFTSALLFIIYICQGQVDKRITIGTIDSVYSELLKENRQLLIYLPETYNNNQKYPVVYLLDGESFFHFYTSIVSQIGRASC